MSDKSEDEVESNRVLEYYKKFSQNPELSKYFTGPEAALIKKPSTSRETYREPQERSNVFTHVQVETIINIENSVDQDVDIENKNVSPTSSISSHKKLEWDNGADIGYTNSYKLSTKKSASFPSLFPSLQTNKLNSQNEEKSISENIEDLRNMYHQLTFSSELSCSPPKDSTVTSSSISPPKVQISSDSSTQSDPKKITSSSDSSNQIPYLQKRIGIPVANSTPFDNPKSESDDLYRETPLLRAQMKPKRNLNIVNAEKTDSQSENLNENSQNKDQRHLSRGNENLVQKLSRVQREINLCLTKPVSLECISQENKECANKLSQTSFTSVLPTKGVQTDTLESRKIINRQDPINVCSPQTLKIEYVQYNSGSGSRSSKTDESSKSNLELRKNRRKTTISDEVQDIEKGTNVEVKSGAFKEINDLEAPKKASQNADAGTSTSSSLSAPTKSNSKSLRSSSGASKKLPDPNSAPGNESYEENILSEMISLKHSRDLNTDIKRSIDILQKLLKSKKYDKSTKKYYIKKIVQKIVESKYSDDSTTSSELFRPKKSNDKVTTQQNVQNDVKLMDNIPWYPADQPKYNLSKRECKTTRTEIFTSTRNFPNTSKPRHAFTSRTTKSDQQILMRNKEDFKATSSRDTQSSDGFVYKRNNDKQPATSIRQDQNWRNGKTCTEILLEKKDRNGLKLGQGDYLLHVAKNERQHQLSWINNEIEHLVNLKTLLEKKEKPDPQLKEVISSLLKMKVEDMKVSSPFQEARNSLKKSDDISGDKEIPSLDEVPSLEQDSSKSPNTPQLLQASAAPFGPYNHDKVQIFMCPTTANDPLKESAPPPAKNCLCQSDTCKCSQTATHEEKRIQCPAFKPCTCQTEQKEDAKIQCCCKADAGVTCTCGQDTCQCKESKSSSSSSSSSSDSYMSCVCCKKQKILKNLLGNDSLCDPCQQVQQKCFYPYNYSNPLHSCLCYSLIDKGTLFQLKNTLTELERLEIYQQYCEVLKNCKCCKKCGCQCKLPKKFKNGCAYFLKLEDACPNKYCDQAGEEYDYEEYGEDDEDEEVNYLPEVTVKVPNCRGPCAQKSKKKSSQNFMSCPSVQSYLCTMKPEFVARAERRRHILRNAVLEREQDVDDRKLKFMQKVKYLNEKLENEQQIRSDANICGPYGREAKTYCVFDVKVDHAPKRVQPHVFKSFKEMKDLTRRRYLHLNEVKNKKDINREKRLREANRILANTFTRRIQRSTLRGNVDIPPNVKVVTY